MPTPTYRVLRAVPALLGCLVATMLVFTLSASPAGAKSRTVPAALRVVNSSGRSLADGTQFTGPVVAIKSSRKADCFGPGTGGSGGRVDVPGTTALGQLAAGGGAFRGIRPLSVTDYFDFGVGLCGIGRAVAPSTGYWYLKVNHAASFSGGDQTPVQRGDEVLWYLIDDFSDPTPDELALRVPAASGPGDPVTVRVLSYADDGSRSPASGALVTGAEAPTDGQGRTSVTAGAGVTAIRATRPGSIPSNTVSDLHRCAVRVSRRLRGDGRWHSEGRRDHGRSRRGEDRLRRGQGQRSMLAGAAAGTGSTAVPAGTGCCSPSTRTRNTGPAKRWRSGRRMGA